MLRFLSRSTNHLIEDVIPYVMEVSGSRVVNYVSFYLSNGGRHLYYQPKLLNKEDLRYVFEKTGKLVEFEGEINVEHLLVKQILGVHFQDHIMGCEETSKFYK